MNFKASRRLWNHGSAGERGEDQLGILVGRNSLAPFVNRTVLNAGTIEALEQCLILH
ncbi:hypothetical protein N9L27_03605 [Candidatus Poseidoniales archaeon]|nr:hypothetical protein [Candidatus Poseidoniales archaeon]MDA8748381.1 hypothetical protein [Candidatus Poseidoniales archaeon]